MNARRGLMWWVFWAGAVLVLAALAWASIAVARLERRNEAGRQTVQHQEVIRLALWRVDSQLAPIIAMEAARTPTAIGNRELRADANFGRSAAAPFVEGFWNIDAANNIDASDLHNRAIGSKVVEERTNLGSIAESATPPAAADTARAEEPEQYQAFDYRVRQQVADIAQQNTERLASPQSKVLGLMESAPALAAPETAARSAGLMNEAAPLSQTVRLEPRWVETAPDRVDLVLVRSIPTEDGPVTEGVTLDWDALKATLEGSLADLIPGALLLPASGAAADRIERDGRGFRLATVPALLVPGDFAPVVPFRMTPALWALVITGSPRWGRWPRWGSCCGPPCACRTGGPSSSARSRTNCARR
jgi:hypothetical protein